MEKLLSNKLADLVVILDAYKHLGNFDINNFNNKIQPMINECISIANKIVKSKTYLTQDMAWFYILGFLPRFEENIEICSVFIFNLIKKMRPDIKVSLLDDGSILGRINARNKENKNGIILQAHMDVVKLSYSNESIEKYGVYGSNPNPQIILSNDTNTLSINKNNDNAVLGADDGKGIISILHILNFTKPQNTNAVYPNITFLLTAVEESPFAKSIRNILSNSKYMNWLFNKNINNKIYFNIDSYSGTEIDTYTSSETVPANKQQLFNELVDEHEKYLKDTSLVSTQATAWNFPPSEILFILSKTKEDQQYSYIDNILLVSLACGSTYPHSNCENINLLELHKFNKWFEKLIIKYC